MRSSSTVTTWRAYEGNYGTFGNTMRDFGTFQAENQSYEEPIVFPIELDPNVPCFTPNHVNSGTSPLGNGSVTLPENVSEYHANNPNVPKVIPAPSWW